MRILFALFCVILSGLNFRAGAATPGRHVVLLVWDGMRPDFVTEKDAPNLYQLARGGVIFAHHHSVYVTATEVNGTAISTGAFPARNGIIANREYRPAINPLKPVNTEAATTVQKGDQLTAGHYIVVPTIAELVRQAGKQAVVAGAKPVALLADRAPRLSLAGGACVFAGETLPASLGPDLAKRQGGFPSEQSLNPTRNDWTTTALLESLWAEGVPEFSLLWMNQPDAAQHQTAPGSRESLAGIRNADENLGQVLRALEAKGVRGATDIMIVSDHGFSTVSIKTDLAAELSGAGVKAVREFKEKPKTGEVLVANHSGSALIYVIGHDSELCRKIVRFLQQWPHTGVIFSRRAWPGTFSLHQARLDTKDAPDIVVSLRWTPAKSDLGVPGLLAVDGSGALTVQGSHCSLSPYDLHNTLIAAGPDFRAGLVDETASGNVDIAPTALWLLGIKPPKSMDGRVLTEALKIAGPAVKSSKPHRLEASTKRKGVTWHQYLNLTEVNGVTYFDEGNGYQEPK